MYFRFIQRRVIYMSTWILYSMTIVHIKYKAEYKSNAIIQCQTKPGKNIWVKNKLSIKFKLKHFYINKFVIYLFEITICIDTHLFNRYHILLFKQSSDICQEIFTCDGSIYVGFPMVNSHINENASLTPIPMKLKHLVVHKRFQANRVRVDQSSLIVLIR